MATGLRPRQAALRAEVSTVLRGPSSGVGGSGGSEGRAPRLVGFSIETGAFWVGLVIQAGGLTTGGGGGAAGITDFGGGIFLLTEKVNAAIIIGNL